MKEVARHEMTEKTTKEKSETEICRYFTVGCVNISPMECMVFL